MLYSLEDLSPKIHETAFIAPNAQIIGDVEILEGASIWFNCVLNFNPNYKKCHHGFFSLVPNSLCLYAWCNISGPELSYHRE